MVASVNHTYAKKAKHVHRKRLFRTEVPCRLGLGGEERALSLPFSPIRHLQSGKCACGYMCDASLIKWGNILHSSRSTLAWKVNHMTDKNANERMSYGETPFPCSLSTTRYLSFTSSNDCGMRYQLLNGFIFSNAQPVYVYLMLHLHNMVAAGDDHHGDELI